MEEGENEEEVSGEDITQRLLNIMAAFLDGEVSSQSDPQIFVGP